MTSTSRRRVYTAADVAKWRKALKDGVEGPQARVARARQTRRRTRTGARRCSDLRGSNSYRPRSGDARRCGLSGRVAYVDPLNQGRSAPAEGTTIWVLRPEMHARDFAQRETK